MPASFTPSTHRLDQVPPAVVDALNAVFVQLRERFSVVTEVADLTDGVLTIRWAATVHPVALVPALALAALVDPLAARDRPRTAWSTRWSAAIGAARDMDAGARAVMAALGGEPTVLGMLRPDERTEAFRAALYGLLERRRLWDFFDPIYDDADELRPRLELMHGKGRDLPVLDRLALTAIIGLRRGDAWRQALAVEPQLPDAGAAGRLQDDGPQSFRGIWSPPAVEAFAGINRLATADPRDARDLYRILAYCTW